MSNLPIVQLSNIYKCYNEGVPVLSDINLTIEQGEKIFIMGESGVGKTTLLNIIGLLTNDYEGYYLLNGKNIKTASQNALSKIRNKKFGIIFQEYALIEDDTVFSNVVIPLIYGDTKRRDYEKKVRDILDYVELGDIANRKVNILSGGQRQRVAVARALINQPDIILADEPTASLNARLAVQVMNILHDYTKNEKALVVVSHDKTLLKNHDYRVMVIEDGKLKTS